MEKGNITDVVTEKKEDVRITRSKRDLRNAFMELLKEQPFDKISVSDICKKATINKMTFYKHYQDKYALLDDCIRAIAENIYLACVKSGDVESQIENSLADFLVKLLSNVMTECYRKKEILLSLVYGNNTSLRFVVENCCKKIVEQLMKRLALNYGFKYPLSAITAFITGGFANVITECLTLPSFSIETFNVYSGMFFNDLLNSNLILDKR